MANFFSNKMKLSSFLLKRIQRKATSAFPSLFVARSYTNEGNRPTIVHKRSLDILHDPWFNKVLYLTFFSFLQALICQLLSMWCFFLWFEGRIALFAAFSFVHLCFNLNFEVNIWDVNLISCLVFCSLLCCFGAIEAVFYVNFNNYSLENRYLTCILY